MDLVTRSGAFTPEEERIINYCRLFLDVITLSDITNAVGDKLIQGIEWGELDNACSVTHNHTTHQPAPAVFFWTYWQRLLRVVANSEGKLFGKLGNWQQPGGHLGRRWNSYFDYRYKFLYRYENDRYLQYELFDTRFINGCVSPWTPNNYCVPVTAQETSHECWMLTAPPALPDHPERPIVSHTFTEYLTYVPAYEQHLFASIQLLVDPYEIISIFNDNDYESVTTDDDTLILDNTPTPPATIHMVSD
jgi:hypothetical protein